MYYLRSSKKPRNSSAERPETPPTFTLTSLLLSHIQVRKSLKAILKLLYSLICSSFSYEVCQGNCSSSAARNGFQRKFEDTIMVSGILFEELHKRLLSGLDAKSVDQKVELPVFHVDGKDSGKELLMLLRCCVLLVRLHPYDQILTEQFQFSVALLRRLSFQEILIQSQSNYRTRAKSSSLDFSAKSSDLYLSVLQQMQEVYLDEVFADRTFRECIAISDSVSSTFQNQAVCSSVQIESVLDIIAAHFLMSFSGKDVLQNFNESLVWTKKTTPSPEVSLPVALSLINHPVMTSSPILLRSHLISLVSEVIGICDFPRKVGPNVRCGKGYLSTFFDSVILYCEHLSKLMTGSCCTGRIIQRPFESHFHSETYDRINFMLVDWDNAWRARNNRMFNKTLSSTAIDAVSYIKMNIYLVDESYRDYVFSFLSSLITRLISVEIDQALLQSFEEMTVQDFYLVASILKLMSCSLLQANRSDKILSCLIAFLKRKDALPGHISLAGLMSFFAEYKFRLPIEVQQFIVDALKPHLSTYEEFELMFLHFAGLLSLCIVSGLRILMKGCLFLMLILVNTLSLELRTDSPTCAPSQVTVTSSNTSSFGISQKTSSLRVASNFRRERRNLLRDQRSSEVSEISDVETCNGEIFLKCVLKKRKDIAELADFIECKPWRDYGACLLSKAKIQRRRFQESARRLRLRLKKIQVRNSVRSKSKRKFIGKPVKV